MKSPAQGAATTVWAAASKVWEGKGGENLADCATMKPCAEDEDMTSAVSNNYAPWVHDWEEEEDELWRVSEKMAGLEAPEP